MARPGEFPKGVFISCVAIALISVFLVFSGIKCAYIKTSTAIADAVEDYKTKAPEREALKVEKKEARRAEKRKRANAKERDRVEKRERDIEKEARIRTATNKADAERWAREDRKQKASGEIESSDYDPDENKKVWKGVFIVIFVLLFVNPVYMYFFFGR